MIVTSAVVLRGPLQKGIVVVSVPLSCHMAQSDKTEVQGLPSLTVISPQILHAQPLSRITHEVTGLSHATENSPRTLHVQPQSRITCEVIGSLHMTDISPCASHVQPLCRSAQQVSPPKLTSSLS